MKLRIGTLAILGVATVTATVIGVMAGILVGAHRGALTAQLSRSADQLSEMIVGTTYEDMLLNRRAALHRQIQAVGRQKGISRVRLFNATGEIVFSSDEREIGRFLDKRAEACYGCHAADQPLQKLSMKQRARVFRGADGQRVLGMIRPIHNERSCWSAACHAHSERDQVLGVLDVNLSLTEADAQIARDQRALILLAVIAIAASSLLLWWLSRELILKPVAGLIAGTRKVAEGDLSTSIPASAQHELGDLARAFNEMTRRLGEAQRQLAQADKLASVGRLAAGVAHEINNPLTGVLTYASFLQKRLVDNAEARADLEVIVRETKRCRDIVRGLLDFARQTPPRRQPTDVNDVLKRGVAITMNQLALAKVALEFDLANDLEPVPADANQIQQVVVNLLINAADAVGEGGHITVSSRRALVEPRGHTHLRSAACPRGCDLIDPNVRIAGFPAVRMLRRANEREALVHLDPVYGRLNHRASTQAEQGTIAQYLCPTCRTSLVFTDARCETCGSAAYGVQVKGRGRVEWCTRKGCGWTRWADVDALGPQPHAEFSIADNGRGIAGEDLGHLFEPFFTTKGTHGSGLGLAITWGILEGHSGTIDVESELGQGTRFVVRLPYLVPDSAGPPADRSPSAVAGATGGATGAATPAGASDPGATSGAAPAKDDARGAA